MRRVLSRGCAALAAVREMVIYSEQSPVLEANQVARNVASNLWIEDWELGRLNIPLNPEDSQPTQVTIRKQLELYNADCLENKLDIIEIPQHFSFASRKAYGNKLQMELSDRAAKFGFQSKAWIARGAIKKENLQLKQNARPVIVLTMATTKVYHESQLIGDTNLSQWPVSGGTRRLYNSQNEAFAKLQEDAIARGASSALYFTVKQLEDLGLKVRADAQALEIQSNGSSNNHFAYFNVDQLADPESVLLSLNRVESAVDCFLMTGEQITMTSLLPTGYKSKYWVQSKDCALYNFQIKPEEVNNGVILSKSRNASLMYNVDDLEVPKDGYKNAGLTTR